MYMGFIVIVLLFVAFMSVCYSYYVINRVKKQITEMTEALLDVKDGNGNRRILAKTEDITAPIAWEINAIIKTYENKIAVFHRTEEANRQLMTSLSHDVRTPLTTLIGYLDGACKGIVSGKDRENYIETARRKAYDLKEHIDVLFDWFKLNSDEFTMKMDKIEMTELTRNILIDWVPVLENEKIDYSIEIPEQPIRVKMDVDGYTRVINNLMQNVITHSRASCIELSLFPQDETVKIVLSDNGVGIEREDLQHIFERLYKCDKGRSDKGSGLGLAIVHQLVEKMNGTITAESIQGKGTTFTLFFSLTD